jgi:hypothetical protein
MADFPVSLEFLKPGLLPRSLFFLTYLLLFLQPEEAISGSVSDLQSYTILPSRM